MLHPAYRGVVQSFLGPDHIIKTMAEFEALRMMRWEDLTPEQIVSLRILRDALGGITVRTRVSKVVPLTGQYNAVDMISSGNPNLAGSFARTSDLTGAVTTLQLIDRVRVDSPPHHFQPGSPHAILETTADAEIAAKAKVPRSGPFKAGPPPNPLDDPVPPDWKHPHTRNGFAASRDGHLLPEFRTEGGNPVKMPAGFGQDGQPLTTMKFRFDDGTPYPQTIDVDGVPTTASDWMLVLDSNSLTGYARKPVP